ncbi:hypothetical protein E4U56_007048 [Claviceps arundinis]|uniref:Myb-like domain-containing protein n=1 Tax=Claviceps arundinis TaxID=1623583 RepID=A0A9P7MWL2_9HYPO|nr:hypothetical protein E4U56_007048 [Claviceps arundinis]
MGSTGERGSLQVQPKVIQRWSAEEDDFLVRSKESRTSWKEISKSLPGKSPHSCQVRYYELRDQRRRGGEEEFKDELARLYVSGKAGMWAPIAAKMAIPWIEIERIHWIIGKNQMAKRGSDDSFSTTLVNLTPRQVHDAEVQAKKQKQDQQQQRATRPGLEWSGHEETLLFAYRRSGLSWEDISTLLLGRTAASCQGHHFQQGATTGPEWPQERKNELCKLYERLKPSMWATIGEELGVSWERAESMHWRLGPNVLEKRAGVPLRFEAASRLAPLQDDIDNAEDQPEVYQHRNEEHDQSSRPPQHPQSQTELAPMAHVGQAGRSVTLPSCAEFIADIDLLHGPPRREK